MTGSRSKAPEPAFLRAPPNPRRGRPTPSGNLAKPLHMADVFNREKRSWIMRQVRGKDTTPEKVVRSWLHAHGYRFSLHRADLPGKPDIVLSSRRTVIFVHGCFWHGHSGCKNAVLPASNREYWEAKFSRNAGRDKRHARALRRSGWHVLTVWECLVRDDKQLERRLLRPLQKIERFS